MNKKWLEKSIAGTVLALTMTLMNPSMTFAGGLAADNVLNDDLQRELAKTQNDLDKQKAKTDDLEARVNDLSNRLEAPKETGAPASPLECPIHGYFVGNYADASGDGANGSFDQATLHLYLDYPLSETFIFHGDLGFNHDTELSIESLGDESSFTLDSEQSVDVEVTEAWLDWKAADKHLIFKFGKFYTPFGVWTPKERPYMTPSVWDPLLTRLALHSRTTTGIQAYGVCEKGSFECSHAVYIGNGHGTLPSSQDDNTNKVLGGRWGLDFNIDKENGEGVGVGINGQIERDGFDVDDSERKTWGFDAKASLANFTLRAETTKSRLNNLDHLWSKAWFWQASYRFLEKFEVYYRQDDADENTRLQDAGDLAIHSVGIAYWPIEQVVFKTAFDTVKIENREHDDYNVVGLQTAVRF
jgi:hypothetical protein